MTSDHVSNRTLLLGVGLVVLVLIFGFAFLETRIALASDPQPVIKLVEVKDNGCKVFKITDAPNPNPPPTNDGIQRIGIADYNKGLKKLKAQNGNSAPPPSKLRSYVQGGVQMYELNYSAHPSEIELTLCPADGKRKEDQYFTIIAIDYLKPISGSGVKVVNEKVVKHYSTGAFSAVFESELLAEPMHVQICEQLRANLKTHNLEDVAVECEIIHAVEHDVVAEEYGHVTLLITMTGKIGEWGKIGTAWTEFDVSEDDFFATAIFPSQGKTFLFVLEVLPFVAPVGGFRVPADKFGLLAPYISLASTILVATAATAIYAKRVKRRKKK